MKVEMAKQNYRNAVRQLLRTINVPVETEVTGVTDLVETLPPLDEERSLEIAYQKRVDYTNAARMLKIAELELDLAENDALPSLSVLGRVSASGQNESMGESVKDIPAFEYPTYYVGLSMTYPLWNKQNKVRQRNSSFKIKRQESAWRN